MNILIIQLTRTRRIKVANIVIALLIDCRGNSIYIYITLGMLYLRAFAIDLNESLDISSRSALAIHYPTARRS